MKLERFTNVLVGTALLAGLPVRANLTFNLIPEAGTPQFAIEGFNAAARLWSDVLADDITLNIQIGYRSLGPGVIGSTSSAFIERSYPELRLALDTHRTSLDDYASVASLQAGDFYRRLINHTSNNPNGPNSPTPYVDTMDRVGLTTANAKALGLLAPGGDVDATIRFNSDLAFDFTHGGTIAAGKFDFVGAAAHEIGHALGFYSGVDDIDTLRGAYPGGDFSSNLIDLFRYSTLSLAEGRGVSDYTADARDKYFSVDGGQTALAWFATGVVYGDGRQASHWKDNSGIGLMDPTLTYGERVDISVMDLRLFDVLGYTIVPEPGLLALFAVSVFLLRLRKREGRRS
ncbi:MAG TPA: NF038122 family metalloprotease [Verrucomicrobiae bacterium]